MFTLKPETNSSTMLNDIDVKSAEGERFGHFICLQRRIYMSVCLHRVLFSAMKIIHW